MYAGIYVCMNVCLNVCYLGLYIKTLNTASLKNSRRFIHKLKRRSITVIEQTPVETTQELFSYTLGSAPIHTVKSVG